VWVGQGRCEKYQQHQRALTFRIDCSAQRTSVFLFVMKTKIRVANCSSFRRHLLKKKADRQGGISEE
jgi:hypothetical protein